MKIELNNGSIIESIDGGKNTRSKRGNDYIKQYAESFSQNYNSFFNPEDIKPLDYNELNGKVLKMIVVENEEVRIVSGQDLESRKVYMISYERYNQRIE